MSDYVDNKKLTKELGDWSTKNRAGIERGESPLKIPDYVAECVYLICNNMGYKSSFINYSYKDEMIGDAIENCIKYIKNFDSRRKNAFGYISTIAYYAFVRKIKKENKRHIDHLSFIRKCFTEDDIRNALDADNPNDIKAYDAYVNHMQSILDDMDIPLPDAPERKKKMRKLTPLEEAMTGESY